MNTNRAILSRFRPGPVLVGIVVLRSLLTVVLWHRAGGFFWLTGDDASRTELAYKWSEAPFFNLPGNVWPPLGIWVHGIVLRFIPDPLLTSSAVNSIFSIASIVLVYGITTTLFPRNPFTPILAAVTAGFCPLVIWLGLSGLSESMFHFFMLVGVYFLLLANRDNRPRHYLGAAIGFLGASMLRLEAWIFVGLFGVFCLVGSRRNEHKLLIFSSAVLAGLFVPLWLGWHWLEFGHPLSFLTASLALNGHVEFWQFVTLLWDNSPVAFILATVGIVASFNPTAKNEGNTSRLYLVFVAAFFLGFVLISQGSIAANMPIRNLTSMFWLLVPFAAFAMSFILTRLPFSTGVTYLTIAALMIGGTVQSFGYRFQASDDIVKMAVWSRHSLQEVLSGDASKGIVVEARHGGSAEREVIWDSLFLHAVNPRFIIYDRRPNWNFKDGDWVLDEIGNPSVLSGPAGEVEQRLRSLHVRFVIAYSEPIRSVLGSIMKRSDNGAQLAGVSVERRATKGQNYEVYAWPTAEPSTPVPRQ